jgi:hypothetical protein
MTIESLQADLAALPSLLDVSGARAQEEIHTTKRVLAARIQEARNAANHLAALDVELAPRIKWREHLREWRPIFVAELQACPATADTREAEYRRLGLEISIRAIDRSFPFATECYPPNLPLFELMKAAGYVAPQTEPWNLWRAGYGSLPTVAQRITELQKLRDEAQARLDAALRDPVPV